MSVDLAQTGGLFTDKDTQERWALVSCYFILVICFVIFLQEVYQMVQNGVRDYFEDIWNIIDLLPLFTASITVALYIEETYTAIESPSVDIAVDEGLRYLRGGASSADDDDGYGSSQPASEHVGAL